MSKVKQATQRKPKAISLKLERITPSKAKQWLATNKENRPLRSSRVAALAESMRQGEWKVNSDTIKFNGDEGLVDGQHRLGAVVESGVTIQSYVARGLDPDVFDTLDQGLRRTISDILARRKEPNYTSLAAAIRWLWVLTTPEQGGRTTRGPLRAKLATTLLEQHPNIRLALVRMNEEDFNKVWSAGCAAALYYLMRQKDAALADDFFHRLGTGENLTRGEPIWHLRNMITRNRNKYGVTEYNPQSLVIGVIKCWNSYRAGDVKNRRPLVRKGESIPEIE